MKKLYKLIESIIITIFFALGLVACSFDTTTTKESTTTKENTTTKSLTPDNSYTVSYSSDVNNVIMDVFWNEFSEDSFLPIEHELESGVRVLKDEFICADVTNNSNIAVVAIIYINDEVIDYRKVDANTKMNPGFYNRQLTGNMVIKVEEYKNYSITYTALSNTTINVYDYSNTDDVKEVASGSKLDRFNPYRIKVTNNKDKYILVLISYSNKTFRKTVDGNSEYETDTLYVENNVEIETLEVTGYNLTVNVDPTISTDTDDNEFIWFTIFYVEYDDEVVPIDLDSSEKIIPTGMNIKITMFNSYTTPITITITYGSTTKTFSIEPNDSGLETDLVLPTDDVTVTISK